MITIRDYQYDQLDNILSSIVGTVSEIKIIDHLGGFDSSNQNLLLEKINNFALNQQHEITVYTSYIFNTTVSKNYAWLKFKTIVFSGWQEFQNYNNHPVLTFENFICSFNGTDHVSRKLLTALLHKFKWFNSNYCSKNFSCTVDKVDGHIADYTDGITGDAHVFYRKFFIDNNQSEEFLRTVYSFDYDRYNHSNNIYALDNRLCKSFLHIVSETMATSYYPLISEKCFYSIVTRGLFLSYAQPGWHNHLEKYFGFKKYTKIFDYRFDTIDNPVERLITLASMVSKFSTMSSEDWRDLYLLEQDTIEYNYNHYYSQGYLKILKQYEKS